MRRFAKNMFRIAFVSLFSALAPMPMNISVVYAQMFSVQKDQPIPPAKLISAVTKRPATRLGGEWQALIQPLPSPWGDAMIASNAQPKEPSDLIEFSFDNGLTLNVPGDWNTQDERLFFYQGKVWYKRTFDYSLPPARRLFLYFGAVNYRASVYLNGKKIVTHRGGFSPFNAEITDAVKQGENLLVVLVDNEHTATDIPTPRTDWLNYGGITRDVKLVETPQTFIRNFKLQCAKDDPETIQGWVQLDGGNAAQPVTLSIPELKLKKTISTNASGFGAFSIKMQAELWSPQNPKLYSVDVATATDAITEKIGFRTIQTRDGKILLNGEQVFLKGISIHEEAPGGTRANNRAQAETLLGWAKELGCNYVRLAHYTHNEHMLRVADSLGLMVWAEIPVYWNVAFSDSGTLANAKQQFADMIDRDQNRACIIIWSLGNETPISEERNAFFKATNEFVKNRDNTRLTSAALLFGMEALQPFFQNYFMPELLGKPGEGDWNIELSDPVADIVDVVSVNEYFGWYYSGFAAQMSKQSSAKVRRFMLDNMRRIRFETGKPLIVSELGAGAKTGKHADVSALAVFSEEYQALVYEKQIEMLRQQRNLVGMSPWILKDFRSPMRLYQGVQDYWNLKGLISDDGRKKQAFFVLQEFYRTQ